MLSNGMGGIEWAGLPYVVEHLGIPDISLFLHQIKVIRAHSPDAKDAPSDDGDNKDS